MSKKTQLMTFNYIYVHFFPSTVISIFDYNTIHRVSQTDSETRLPVLLNGGVLKNNLLNASSSKLMMIYNCCQKTALACSKRNYTQNMASNVFEQAS